MVVTTTKEGEAMRTDENTIWNSRQNHPELVVQDCRKEFNLTDEQCDKLRFILLNRGINKWLYCRRHFIKLKHEIKHCLRIADRYNLREKTFLGKLNERMQNIAKTPRWVEWNTHIHKKMRNNEREIKVKGRHC